MLAGRGCQGNADLTVTKLQADFALIQCVADAAGWPFALLMGLGVILGGLPWWLRARRPALR